MTEQLPFGNQPDLPVGEGLVGGFVAPIHSAVLWMVSCYDELDAPMVRSTPSGFHWYYWPEGDFEAADKARESVDQYGPSLVWRLEVMRDEILSSTDLSMFGDSIGGDIAVKTLTSNKYRHELHLLALPAAVAATARLLGFDVPAFDVADIADRFGDYNDERSARLIGNPDVRKAPDPKSDERDRYCPFCNRPLDADSADGSGNCKSCGAPVRLPNGLGGFVEGVVNYTEIHYTESSFWRQRVAIWKALGEDNPLAYLAEPKEDMKPKMIEKYVTTSDKLAQCLRVFSTWKAPLWGRLVLVADPRVDATYGDDKRLSLPLIMALYKNEDEARAALEADGVDLGAGGTSGDKPPYPEGWDDGELRKEWPITMKNEIMPKFKGPKPVREKKIRAAADELMDSWGVTPDDVIAWWDAV